MAQRIHRQARFIILVGVLFLLLIGCGETPIILTIENQTGQPLCEVYISPDNHTDFGENQLETDDRIDNGKSRTFQVSSGEYDLLVRNCAQETVFSHGAVNAEARFLIGGENVQPLRLYNQSSLEICYVYFAPAQTGDWGEDQLAQVESILPGEKRIFFQPPGSYHVRAAGCDDQTVAEVQAVDLTNPFDWVVAP